MPSNFTSFAPAVIVTGPPLSVSWSLAGLFPNVRFPPVVNVSPSSATFALNVFAVSPAATSTLSWNVTSPALFACVIPLAVATVLWNSVVPAELIVMAAPAPLPRRVLVPA